MRNKTIEDELDLATAAFLNTYNAFREAALNLMAIMEGMTKKKYQTPKALSRENQQIHDFLIHMMDDSGQFWKKSFGLRCMAEEEKKERQ